MSKNNFFLNFFKIYFSELFWFKLSKSLNKIKLLVVDVDGVLTDGKIYLNSNEEELKGFDVKDGLGLKLLKESGIKVAFLSGSKSVVTKIRAKNLEIDFCEIGVKNKKLVLSNLQKQIGIDKSETVYVGDDLNDIPVKELVNLFFVPRDASEHLLSISDLILSKNGGNGAIRELSERILKSNGFLEKFTLKGWVDLNN